MYNKLLIFAYVVLSHLSYSSPESGLKTKNEEKPNNDKVKLFLYHIATFVLHREKIFFYMCMKNATITIKNTNNVLYSIFNKIIYWILIHILFKTPWMTRIYGTLCVCSNSKCYFSCHLKNIVDLLSTLTQSFRLRIKSQCDNAGMVFCQISGITKWVLWHWWKTTAVLSKDWNEGL